MTNHSPTLIVHSQNLRNMLTVRISIIMQTTEKKTLKSSNVQTGIKTLIKLDHTTSELKINIILYKIKVQTLFHNITKQCKRQLQNKAE